MKVYRLPDGRFAEPNPKRRKRTNRKKLKRTLKHHAKEAARESVSGAIAMIGGVAIIGLLAGSQTKV